VGRSRHLRRGEVEADDLLEQPLVARAEPARLSRRWIASDTSRQIVVIGARPACFSIRTRMNTMVWSATKKKVGRVPVRAPTGAAPTMGCTGSIQRVDSDSPDPPPRPNRGVAAMNRRSVPIKFHWLREQLKKGAFNLGLPGQ